MKKDQGKCNIRGCIGRYLLSVVLVFLFICVLEFLVHGVWLMSLYEQTARLWRPQEEMNQFFPFMFLYHALIAFILTALYCKYRKSESCGTAKENNKPCRFKGGLCFGITIGLLLGVTQGATYIWMPIPLEMGIKWFVAGIIEGVGIGLILSFTCYKKDSSK